MDTPNSNPSVIDGLHVAIVGAGIGGLTCAIACRRATPSLRVTVMERTSEILTIGAGIHIPPNACRVLRSFGLLDKLKDAGSYQQDFFRLRRYENGQTIVEKPLKALSMAEYGAEWLAIHRGDYQQVLLHEASALGACIMTGAEVVDVVSASDGYQTVLLKGGNSISADVVIGADGLWSRVREVVLGCHFPPVETGDLAYRGTFTRNQLKDNRSEELDELLEQSDMQVWLGPGKHAAFYPLRNHREYNLVLVVADDLPANARTSPGNLEEMAANFEGWDPILTDIISILESSLKWKLFHFKELNQWTKGAIALMGDASHPTLPYQGQGAAMAVEDGAILGLILGRFQSTASRMGHGEKNRMLSSLLSLYESLRKERTKVNVEGAMHTRHYYHLADGGQQLARDGELKDLPSKGWKNRCSFNWGDAEYQNSLLGLDVLADAATRYDEWWEAIRKPEHS